MAAEALDFSAIDSAVDDVQDQAFDNQEQTDDQVVDQQTDDSDGGGDGGAQQTQGEKVDGRRGPANIRNSIKAATEALPDQAQAFKELGGAYFREAAYKQHFGTPQEAASAKQLIESVGGVDGISTLQQRDAMYSQQDEFLKSGNPEIIDDFFSDFPEGAAALAPHYLEKLSKVNPEAFASAVVPYAVGMLQGVGFGDYLKAIVDETDPARAKKLVQQLSTWFNGEQGKVQQMRQAQPKNPSNDRVKEQQTKLDQEREQLFHDRVNEKISSKVDVQLGKVVEQWAKKNGWNDEQKQEFRARLLQDVAAQMDKDDTYKKQAGLRYANKSRTHDTVANFISGEFLRRMNDKDGALATEAKVNKLFGKTTKVKPQTTGTPKAGGPKTAPGGGAIKISAEPSQDQINWGHPDAEVLYIQNEAWLKNGRHVRW
ncbi:MAG: hypothetical protein ACLGXA_24445 [Acidobacteriota bacterium]